MRILATKLDRRPFVRGNRTITSTLLSDHDQRQFAPSTSAVTKRLATSPDAALDLLLGTDTTLDQRHDAELIRQQAATMGIRINLIERRTSLRDTWEQEDYPLMMVRMGMWSYDEVELLNGYFCANFRPYRSLAPIVCSDIRSAAAPGATENIRRQRLGDATSSLVTTGWILPLYRFPRFYLIRTKWDASQHNRSNPYPMFYRMNRISSSD